MLTGNFSTLLGINWNRHFNFRQILVVQKLKLGNGLKRYPGAVLVDCK